MKDELPPVDLVARVLAARGRPDAAEELLRLARRASGGAPAVEDVLAEMRSTGTLQRLAQQIRIDVEFVRALERRGRLDEARIVSRVLDEERAVGTEPPSSAGANPASGQSEGSARPPPPEWLNKRARRMSAEGWEPRSRRPVTSDGDVATGVLRPDDEAELHLRAGRPEKAIALYRQLAEWFPTNPRYAARAAEIAACVATGGLTFADEMTIRRDLRALAAGETGSRPASEALASAGPVESGASSLRGTSFGSRATTPPSSSDAPNDQGTFAEWDRTQEMPLEDVVAGETSREGHIPDETCATVVVRRIVPVMG